MQLLFSTWTHHLNHLIYSYFYFCQKEKIKVVILRDPSVVSNGAILDINGEKIFFDYSDDSLFLDNPEKFSLYFKRSLRKVDENTNIRPLNFNVPLSYKSLSLLMKLKSDLLLDKWSRVEVLKAFDIYGLASKSSHCVLDIRRYPENVIDNGGKVLFHTRLWNPDNHPDTDEKERRRLQNEFRINACRIIKKNFSNSSVGLFADDFSRKLAPDVLLDPKESKKNNYLNTLLHYNIALADDGLKDTPGWKIGEYLLFGKAVITTPLNISLDNFKEGINYEVLSTRSSYIEIPDKIECLLKEKKYLEVGNANKEWSNYYIHPQNYIERILSIVK
ncbi:hypothetical protein [Flavobacterium sp. 83]|uniref:hypothetical protein n=1 Tax=Flavobacterium sp. 83 TaxID=1131812 RepID=UPI000554DA4A|nr:hypothetical protein [Flavobacterium sp. 83]